jgi:hypothetical protein
MNLSPTQTSVQVIHGFKQQKIIAEISPRDPALTIPRINAARMDFNKDQRSWSFHCFMAPNARIGSEKKRNNHCLSNFVASVHCGHVLSVIRVSDSIVDVRPIREGEERTNRLPDSAQTKKWFFPKA